MKLFLIGILTLMSLKACSTDETVRSYGGADKVWTLTELNGTPFQATATLTFPETGQIAGQTPCNRYFGAMEAPYPWFKTGPIGSTRRACPDMKAESDFLRALEAATLSEVAGDILILSNTDGLQMVFKSTE